MRGRFTGIMLAVNFLAICNVGVAATSPGQPHSGPGGSNYPHAAVVKNFITLVSDDHGKPALVADHFAPCAFDSDYDSGERRDQPDKNASVLSRLKETLSSRALERSSTRDFPSLDGGSHSADALDYYGLWKLFDGLCDAAFYGKNLEYALGNTPQQRFMGKWSDEVPVKELIVADNP